MIFSRLKSEMVMIAWIFVSFFLVLGETLLFHKQWCYFNN